MVSEMARAAADDFEEWLASTKKDGEHTETSLAVAFYSWLTLADGLYYVAENYGLCVETLLTIVVRHRTPPLPVVRDDDDMAWDFMTPIGFEQLVFNRHHSMPRLRDRR